MQIEGYSKIYKVELDEHERPFGERLVILLSAFGVLRAVYDGWHITVEINYGDSLERIRSMLSASLRLYAKKEADSIPSREEDRH